MRGLEGLKNFLRARPWFGNALFFVGGVIFDLLTLGRIDDTFNIVQQAIYLGLLGVLLAVEIRDRVSAIHVPQWAQKIWGFREELVHFLFGSLLSVYAIFYIKSASLVASLGFLTFILALLVGNELPQFRSLGLRMRFALWTLCLASFFAILWPVLAGFLVWWLFLAAIASSGIIVLIFIVILRRWVPDPLLLRKNVLWPSVSILGIFLAMYWLAWIPPVPLSLQYVGLYHRIERVADRYRLSYERPWWRFWEKGSQNFVAQPGDKLHLFARIFSPGGFSGKIFVHWQRKENERWVDWDRIPITVVGGRDEGFRGVAVKGNYAPGKWRVLFETEDTREVGRFSFTIEAASDAFAREWRVDEQ